MNDTPIALRQYRNDLRSAVALDLDSRGRRRILGHIPRRIAVPAVVAAAAAAAALAFFLSAGSQTQTANAAILRSVAAALTPPPGTILHEQAQVSVPGQAAHPFELWEQADSPYAYRVIKWGGEGSWNGSSFSSYDAASNTITTSPGGGQARQPADFAATLRSLVESGQATVDGTTTIAGVQAYKLTVSSSPDPFLIGTAYVDATNYHPLEIDTVTDSETIVYQAYEYLPATSANLQLLDLAAQHPGANTVTG
jgi:hypothetical protein